MVPDSRPVRAFPEGPAPNSPQNSISKPAKTSFLGKGASKTQNLILVKVCKARACENEAANLQSEPRP